MYARFFTTLTTLVAIWSTTTTAAAIVPAYTRGNASWPYQTYRTKDFTPPWLDITNIFPYRYPGYLFIAPGGPEAYQTAPLIMNLTDGELIWNGWGDHAFNFGVQIVNGTEHLVFWDGVISRSPQERSDGVICLLDKTYEITAVVDLPGHFLSRKPDAFYASNIDVYEAYMTAKNTILVMVSNVTQFDLSSVGGPADGWIVNSLFREIDLLNNTIVFEWNALEHIDQLPLTESLYPLGSEGFTGVTQELAWDYFHINSVSPFQNGFLISSSNFCSAFAIQANGCVKWRLQGKDGGDFKLGEGANFCFQHDVRSAPVRPSDSERFTLHMHDNSNSPIENGLIASSGLALTVDPTAMSVLLAQRFLNASAPMLSNSGGNLQAHFTHWFVGRGWIPVAEEYDRFGNIVTTVQFGAATSRPASRFSVEPSGPGTFSYRAFRQEWVGCPQQSPFVVAEIDGNGTTVYVSWNGATEVYGWNVFSGWSNDNLTLLVFALKTGFETEVHIKRVNYVEVVPVLMAVGATAHGEYTYRCDYADNMTSGIVSVVA